MNDREIVVKANELAARFCRLHGFVPPDGFRFDQAKHERERRYWSMAAAAFDLLLQTDVEDALIGAEFPEDEPEPVPEAEDDLDGDNWFEDPDQGAR